MDNEQLIAYLKDQEARKLDSIVNVVNKQIEVINLLKTEIIRLVKESEMHKHFINQLFAQNASTIQILEEVTHSPVDMERWRALTEYCGDYFEGMYDELQSKVDNEISNKK